MQIGSGKSPSKVSQVPTDPIGEVTNYPFMPNTLQTGIFYLACFCEYYTDIKLLDLGGNKCPLSTFANQKRINVKWQPGLALIAGWILVV